MDLHVVDLRMILTRWTIYGEQNEPILAADVEVPIPIFLQTKTSRKEKFYQALLFISVYSCNGPNLFIQEGGFRGGVQGVCTFPPPHPQDDLRNYDTTSQLLKKTVLLLSLHCQQSLIMSLLLCCSLLKFVDVTHQLRHSFVAHPSPPPPQPSPRSSVFIEQRKDLNDMRIEVDCINPCFIMLGHQKLLTVEIKCTGK